MNMNHERCTMNDAQQAVGLDRINFRDISAESRGHKAAFSYWYCKYNYRVLLLVILLLILILFNTLPEG